MNDTQSQDPSAESREMVSMMFAQLVMQQSNMALIFLGKAPNPQTGQTSQDLDHARYFIDQLEMLEVKTRGNLDSHENSLLKQSLTTLRLAFVDAVSKPQPPPAAEKTAAAPESPKAAEPSNAAEQSTPAAEPANPAAPAETAGSAESHKKFTKKY